MTEAINSETARATFVNAMSAAVTGVTIVTTNGPGGRLGRTISAMASVSADPPMLLVCVNRRSPLELAIRANGVFGVSVLGEHQADVSDAFAGRSQSATPFVFAARHWDGDAAGVPLLAGAAACFACRLESATKAGTHTVFIGGVLESGHSTASPLAYTGRTYARPLRLAA
jgi:flavin reductase (DIM6/NTAB) family NADH-FMN oxidoreductase RutF